MCVPSPISNKQLYKRSVSCPYKRHASHEHSFSSSHQQRSAYEDCYEPAFKKTALQQQQHRQYEQLQQKHHYLQQLDYYYRQQQQQQHEIEYLPLSLPNRHHPNNLPRAHNKASTHHQHQCYKNNPHHNHHSSIILSHTKQRNHHPHKVQFAQTSTAHIIQNLTTFHNNKPALWINSSQIAQNKRKVVVLVAFLLKKRKRLTRSEFEGGLLMGLERHLFDDDDVVVDGTIDDDDANSESASSGSDGSEALATSDANSDTSSNGSSNSSSSRGSNKSSSSRQQLFKAVLQEQHRQHQIGIRDVEALARVSMEKSQRARERARAIGIWQSM